MGTATLSRQFPYREKEPRKISIQTFLEKYRDGAPGVKYEFNKGVIEKTEAMKMSERYIILNLRKRFTTTPAAKRDESLECESEVWTSKDQWRKPDLSHLTLDQTLAAANGEEPVPEFLIEVISKNDSIIVVEDKIIEYFQAGTKILWLIFPHIQTVKIYRSVEDIEVCSGEKICSAEPVVEGFRMKAADIFRKP